MQVENNGVSDERKEEERECMLRFFVGATNDWCAGDWRPHSPRPPTRLRSQPVIIA